jgi:hypothetical protein
VLLQSFHRPRGEKTAWLCVVSAMNRLALGWLHNQIRTAELALSVSECLNAVVNALAYAADAVSLDTDVGLKLNEHASLVKLV